MTEHLSASLNLQVRLLSLFILIMKCVCLRYERNKIYTIHIHLHVANGRPLPKSRLICALYDRVEEFDTILVRFRASKNLLLADSAQKNLCSLGSRWCVRVHLASILTCVIRNITANFMQTSPQQPELTYYNIIYTCNEQPCELSILYHGRRFIWLVAFGIAPVVPKQSRR